MPGPVRTHRHKPDPRKYPAPTSVAAVLREFGREVAGQVGAVGRFLGRLIPFRPAHQHGVATTAGEIDVGRQH